MPARKRAPAPSQFIELLEPFPCPAWIENSSGKILARNARIVAGVSCSRLRKQDALSTLETVAYPLPPVGSEKNIRLVAHFPATRKTNCQHGEHGVISALLAKILQLQSLQFATPNAASDEIHLTPCEREVYCELEHSSSYKEIAATLGISHEAVRQRVVQLRQKLGSTRIPFQRSKNQTFLTKTH